MTMKIAQQRDASLRLGARRPGARDSALVWDSGRCDAIPAVRVWLPKPG